jgi:hypothetical protein
LLEALPLAPIDNDSMNDESIWDLDEGQYPGMGAILIKIAEQNSEIKSDLEARYHQSAEGGPLRLSIQMGYRRFLKFIDSEPIAFWEGLVPKGESEEHDEA